MRRRQLLQLCLLTGVVTLLAGCGFQLRGTASVALPAEISPLRIQGVGGNDMTRRELELLLVESGVTLADQSEKPASVLRLRDRRSERRVISIDSSGKVVEYELFESLRFDLLDAAGETRVEEQRVNLERSHLNPEVEVIGKQIEEQTLRQEMRRELAGQIMRQLAAQLR